MLREQQSSAKYTRRRQIIKIKKTLQYNGIYVAMES